MAALAFHQRVGAVQLDEALAAGACEAVETVNVLRDDHQELPGYLQLHNRFVDSIRPGVTKRLPSFELVVPVLDPRRL